MNLLGKKIIENSILFMFSMVKKAHTEFSPNPTEVSNNSSNKSILPAFYLNSGQDKLSSRFKDLLTYQTAPPQMINQSGASTL